jgi:hypothetical protein
LFGFIAFLGVSQRWEFKGTTKYVVPKKTNKNPKPKPIVLCFLLSRFWVFYGEGGLKTTHHREKASGPGIVEWFWPLTLTYLLTRGRSPRGPPVFGFVFLPFAGPMYVHSTST